MPRRSKVQRLPDPVRDELNRRLIGGGFSDYEGLAEWLTGQGYAISVSAVHRYGQQFERRLGALEIATEQTKVIVERLGDDAGAMGQAVTALVQQGTYEVLLEMLETKEYGDLDLGDVGQMVARLNKTDVLQKRWASEMRAKAQAAADEVGAIAQKAGLSDEAAAEIRRKILGIAA